MLINEVYNEPELGLTEGSYEAVPEFGPSPVAQVAGVQINYKSPVAQWATRKYFSVAHTKIQSPTIFCETPNFCGLLKKTS